MLCVVKKTKTFILFCKNTCLCSRAYPAWELRFFSLKKRKLQGHRIAAFQYTKTTYKKAGEGLFTKACSDRTRDNVFKLKEFRFRSPYYIFPVSIKLLLIPF